MQLLQINMDPPITWNSKDFHLEILSDASEEEIHGEKSIDEPEPEDDNFVTPPPRLTIGDVLGTIPKLKNGKSNIRESSKYRLCWGQP